MKVNKHCRKENLIEKWRMTVSNWVKIKFLHCGSINKLFHAFYSLMIFVLVLEICIFVIQCLEGNPEELRWQSKLFLSFC